MSAPGTTSFPKSVGAHSRCAGKENQPALLRHLAEADALQSLQWRHSVRARSDGRVSSRRRQVRGPDSGSHRRSRPRLQRSEVRHARRRSRGDARAARWRPLGCCGRVSVAVSLRLGRRRATESALHLRRLRHRQRQPVCPRRVPGRRRASFQGLQPAVPLWRRRHGQDAPDAGDRPRDQAAHAASGHLLRLEREVHQRHDQLAALRQDDQLPRQVPRTSTCC